MNLTGIDILLLHDKHCRANISPIIGASTLLWAWSQSLEYSSCLSSSVIQRLLATLQRAMSFCWTFVPVYDIQSLFVTVFYIPVLNRLRLDFFSRYRSSCSRRYLHRLTRDPMLLITHGRQKSALLSFTVSEIQCSPCFRIYRNGIRDFLTPLCTSFYKFLSCNQYIQLFRRL